MTPDTEPPDPTRPPGWPPPPFLAAITTLAEHIAAVVADEPDDTEVDR